MQDAPDDDSSQPDPSKRDPLPLPPDDEQDRAPIEEPGDAPSPAGDPQPVEPKRIM